MMYLAVLVIIVMIASILSAKEVNPFQFPINSKPSKSSKKTLIGCRLDRKEQTKNSDWVATKPFPDGTLKKLLMTK